MHSGVIVRLLEKIYAYKSLIRTFFLKKVLGMDIADTANIAYRAKLDKVNPHGIHIGEHTWVTHGVVVLSHDFIRNLYTDTYIGTHCFIGMNSIILPGVRIGDHVIIGAGSVVTKDIPAYSIAAGNPASVIKTHDGLQQLEVFYNWQKNGGKK